MQCPNCGAELENGTIYCKKCGSELQIVPDYDPLDELLLLQEHSLNTSSKKSKKEASEAIESKVKKELPPKEASSKNRNAAIPKTKGLCIILSMILLILVGFSVFLFTYFSIGKEQNYSYQLKKGQTLYQNGSYEEALSYLKQAAKLQSKTEGADTAPYYYMAYTYAALASPQMARSCMETALQVEEDARGDTDALMELYLDYMDLLNQIQETSAISEVMDSCRYPEIKAALEPYRIEKPACDVPEGTYSYYLKLQLSAPFGTIYYTLDGTEPTPESTRYDGAITLEEGETLLSAIAVNQEGMISDKLVLVYKIEFQQVYNEKEEE